MNRRSFLRRAGALSVAATAGGSLWARALAAPTQAGPSPYGELLAPDANGLMLPSGFTSRVVASSLQPVPGTSHVWHLFPDGGGCVPTDDGGWIYVSNSEFPVPIDVPGVSWLLAALNDIVALPQAGGVGAIRFGADGTIVDAYPILEGSLSNCAGGLTPWGTWLSCEEWEDTGDLVRGYSAGRVWECDPFGGPAAPRPSLGRFKHEMAAVDPDRHQIYLTEDQPDGLIYRYTPPDGVWGSGDALEGGWLEAMQVGPGGATTWLAVTGQGAPAGPLRHAVPGATTFDGGEGVIHDLGRIYVSSKGDDRIWVHDIAAQTMAVLYDSASAISPVLTGVDNVAVSAGHDLYVAEDGGNLEVCVITPDLVVAPVVRMTGPQHGLDTGTPLPLISEVTGIAFSPDGNRLYFNSERGLGLAGLPIGPGPGITYEVTGPFRGGTMAAASPAVQPAPSAAAAPTRQPAAAEGTEQLPATGRSSPLPAAALGGAAGAALLHLRRRADRTTDGATPT